MFLGVNALFNVKFAVFFPGLRKTLGGWMYLTCCHFFFNENLAFLHTLPSALSPLLCKKKKKVVKAKSDNK